MPSVDIDALTRGVLARERGTLARAITLVESTLPRDMDAAHELLTNLAPHAEATPTTRVGISGVPGAGKSSLLDVLGSNLVDAGQRVAVLAVDPTSSRSGGSILGDKTRMERLSRSQDAFIRPTAGGGELGGVARRTREAILVCEAAGFDTIFVETIGIGQSEAAVYDLVDTFVLLMLTGAGDDLQGIKRGALELADMLVVTKADGTNEDAAGRTVAELKAAMQILHGHDLDRIPWTGTCSAQTESGIQELWAEIEARRERTTADGSREERRRAQDLAWFERTVDDMLRARFLGGHVDAMVAARQAVQDGREFPLTAARALLADT